MTAKLIIIGFVIGILSGLLGIGGGVFLVPVLVSYFAIAQHNAHGTSLAVIIPTALVSSSIYGWHGSIDFTLSLQILTGSIAGAAIGARIMKKLPAYQLKRMFGILLIIVGIRMVLP